MGFATQHIEAAADIIDRNGLYLGPGDHPTDPTDPDAVPPVTVPVSVSGAIRLAVTGTGLGLTSLNAIAVERVIYDVTWHVLDFLHATYGKDAANLTAWQNKPARTAAEASAMLRACAVWERPGGFVSLR